MNAVPATDISLDDLVDARERLLGGITLAMGLVVWVAVILGTLGVALLLLLFAWLSYLFVHSALIAHVKGNGVQISAGQFSDLQARLGECCDRLRIKVPPQAYVVNGNGVLNAFATHFLRHEYVVLNSDVVDAMLGSDEGIRFYIGHELGHLRMKHLTGQLLRAPVLWLPLIGAAYSRARERTCDRHGAACSDSAEASVRALGALAAGKSRWRKLNVEAYVQQAGQGRGFWMSLHELLSGYPWLTRRAAFLMGNRTVLQRSPLAYVVALFIPYGGRFGPALPLLVMVYVILVVAVVAVPMLQQRAAQARLELAMAATAPVRERLADYYAATGKVPASLEALGINPMLSGLRVSLNRRTMELTVTTASGELILVPSADSKRQVTWQCTAGAGVTAAQLPASCR